MKRIISIAAVTAIIAIAGCIIWASKTEPTFGTAGNELKILIDAGHGAPDGGAVGVSGTVEKDINLSIAQKVGEILTAENITVEYTRTGDEGLQDESAKTIREMKVSDMKKRRELMKESKADLFLSIHMNSFPNGNASGLHIFYSAKYPETEALAVRMQDEIAGVTGAATHAVKTVSEKLFLMKEPPLPCILAECGFLSNAEEERKLKEEEYQARIAWGISRSIVGFYGKNE